MPNIKSAEKRMRTSRVRAERNRTARSRLRTAIKRVRMAETRETAEPLFQKATALLDRSASKNLLHPNKAARTKSQLAKHIQSLES